MAREMERMILYRVTVVLQGDGLYGSPCFYYTLSCSILFYLIIT